ncbi:MAG TPA: hypothetical protein EYO01_03380 [Phycisphaerales bacterium]|nr:hypothetical protein [Phycisphaerales bacterium]
MKKLTILLLFLFAAPAVANTYVVTASSTSWSPSTLTVVPGDIIRFEYGSGYPHTITSGTSCTPDGLYFNEPLTGSGDFYEWAVPSTAPSSVPFFCSPHCNFGMTGVIYIDQPQGVMEIGLVDIVNPEPLTYTHTATTETISILGTTIEGTSFFIGVEILDFDVDVQYYVTSKTNSVLFMDVAAGTDIPLNGTGTLTLTAGNRYGFAGDAIFSNFMFEITYPSNQNEGASFVGITLNGHGSVHNSGDSFMFRSSGLGTGEMVFEGEGDLLMSVAGEVSSTTLTLPPAGTEGVVTVPIGLHTVLFQDVALMTLNMGGGGSGGGGMPEDVNGDGVVDVSDLLAIIAVWGATSP